MIDGRPLSSGSSPCRAFVTSMNPGGGHGGLLLDCDGIIWCGVMGAFIFAVAVGWLSSWVANRDPCGWAQLLQLWLWLQPCGMGSIGLGGLTSVQLDSTAAAKTPTSMNKTIGSTACWSSITLFTRQQGWPGIGGWASSVQYCNALA